MKIDVCGQISRHGYLLAGQLGELSNVELRRVELKMDGTGFGEGPLAQLRTGIEREVALRSRIEFRVLQAHVRGAGINSGADQLPRGSMELKILRVELAGEMRRCC